MKFRDIDPRITTQLTPGERARQNRRRHIPVVAAGAAVAVAVGVAGDAITNHVEKVVRTVPTPVGEQKIFHLGETFKVGDKEVTIHTLGEAAVAAHLPNVYSSATLSMLEKQVALNGVTDTTIPGDMEFSLPMDSAIGHKVTVE